LTGYSDNYIKVMFDDNDSLMTKLVPVDVDYVNLMYTIGKRCKTRKK
jgi:hypothetical protein